MKSEVLLSKNTCKYSCFEKGVCHPLEVFFGRDFFLLRDDRTAAPDVCSGCSITPRARFQTS